MVYPSREIVESLRKIFKKGQRVRLIKMDKVNSNSSADGRENPLAGDAQAPPVGTLGTVYGVDDTGSIMVSWDNGSGLNIIYGEDKVELVF